MSLVGEWEARFDPQLTQKGEFYLDNKNFVHVDMMRSAKYPLSLLEDGELGAQVSWAGCSALLLFCTVVLNFYIFDILLLEICFAPETLIINTVLVHLFF